MTLNELLEDIPHTDRTWLAVLLVEYFEETDSNGGDIGRVLALLDILSHVDTKLDRVKLILAYGDICSKNISYTKHTK